MEDLIEIVFGLFESALDALDIADNLRKYWRFWLPTGVAGIATWGVNCLVSNSAIGIAFGMVFMLFGILGGIFLQVDADPD